LERRATLVQEPDALLDALQRPLHVAFEALEDTDRVVVGAGADAIGVGMRLFDDPLALGLGGLGQTALVDEEGCLLLGAPDDALRLLLGLLDDPLALRVDALRRADLFGDGDTELIDEPESGVLVDDNVRRERQLLAVGDQRLEALDEEDDVDVVNLLRVRLWHAPMRQPRLDDASRTPERPPERLLRRGRHHRRDVSAERGDLLDETRADVTVRGRRHEEDRVDLGREHPVVVR
jgi:hypothetical protein